MSERNLRVEAAYFDGQTSQRHMIEVERTSTGLVLRGESIGERVWDWHELRREERLSPADPIRYERGSLESPEVLVIADSGFLPAMRGTGRADRSLAHRLRHRSIVSLLLPAIVAVLAAVAFWALVLPVLAARVAERVPLEIEDRLGRSTVELTTQFAGVCREPARVAALQGMVDRLVADGRGGRYTYRVNIVDDSLVNAFAAPGGHIVVFQGLIAQAGSPDEVAGVLAHEIQHVTNHHGIASILREMPVQIALSTAFGSNPFGGSLAQAAYSLGSLSYRRRDELEADAGAAQMLLASGISPEGMIDFFRRTAARSGETGRWTNYLSTHPSDTERIEALSAAAANSAISFTPAISAAEWAALRAPCTLP